MNDEMHFILAYENLCIKYDMRIGACGCCGSPFLVGLINKDLEPQKNGRMPFVAWLIDWLDE